MINLKMIASAAIFAGSSILGTGMISLHNNSQLSGEVNTGLSALVHQVSVSVDSTLSANATGQVGSKITAPAPIKAVTQTQTNANVNAATNASATTKKNSATTATTKKTSTNINVNATTNVNQNTGVNASPQNSDASANTQTNASVNTDVQGTVTIPQWRIPGINIGISLFGLVK